MNHPIFYYRQGEVTDIFGKDGEGALSDLVKARADVAPGIRDAELC